MGIWCKMHMGANFQESTLWFSITYLQSGQERHFWERGHTVQPSAAGQSILLPSQRYTLIPPSLHTQAPSYQKTLVILESATSQGNLSLQHKTLLGSFHFLLHIYLKCQSGGPLVDLARSQKKSTAFLRWIPLFTLQVTQRKRPAWEMRNCSPFIR